MPSFKYRNRNIYYEFTDEGDGPVIVFVNGITQRTAHWASYAEYFKKHGIRAISYDLLGQGLSDKPMLDYDFNENPTLLAALLDHCGVEQAYISGISFGGVVVLKFGLEYPHRCRGLIPMSTFSELDGRLKAMGIAMYEGMVRVGFEYLLDWLIPINFSSARIDAIADSLAAIKRTSANGNDLYSIQNLIESIRGFTEHGFTEDLPKIQCPTLIMNAEYDYLTPRWCHEKMRAQIRNSRLMLIQHAYHAFTLEVPDVTLRVLTDFIQSVENGTWQGDQTVWVAHDDVNAPEVAFPCLGDHTRAIPFPYPAASAAPVAAPAPTSSADASPSKPARPKASASKAVTSQAAPSKAAAPKAATPKAATPKAATPKAATPKAATPKAATPKAAAASKQAGAAATPAAAKPAPRARRPQTD